MTCGQLPTGGCGNPNLGHIGACSPRVNDRIRFQARQGTVTYVTREGIAWVKYDTGRTGILRPGEDHWDVLRSR